MPYQTGMDLMLKTGGQIGAGLGRDIAMSGQLTSGELMVGQGYIGPPVREQHLAGLSILRAGAELPAVDGGDARIILDFIDIKPGDS